MLWWCSRYISKCNMREGSLVPKMFGYPLTLFFLFQTQRPKLQKDWSKGQMLGRNRSIICNHDSGKKKFSKPLVQCRKANQVKRKTKTNKNTQVGFLSFVRKETMSHYSSPATAVYTTLLPCPSVLHTHTHATTTNRAFFSPNFAVTYTV